MVEIQNNKIIFNKKDIETAWNKAPKLINKDENEMRMCYICKFHMIKENYLNEKEMFWGIDFINTKKLILDETNLIAVHPGCIEYRPKADCTKVLKKVNQFQWVFDEQFYNKK